MNVEHDEIRIEPEHARIFARAIYRDVGSYIQAHQEEYQAFLIEEAEDNDGEITTTYRPQRGEHKAK